MEDKILQKIKAFTDSKEHEYQCIGYSEGVRCCLEKDEILEKVIAIITESLNG